MLQQRSRSDYNTPICISEENRIINRFRFRVEYNMYPTDDHTHYYIRIIRDRAPFYCKSPRQRRRPRRTKSNILLLILRRAPQRS